jgi:hypothetical protein
VVLANEALEVAAIEKQLQRPPGAAARRVSEHRPNRVLARGLRTFNEVRCNVALGRHLHLLSGRFSASRMISSAVWMAAWRCAHADAANSFGSRIGEICDHYHCLKPKSLVVSNNSIVMNCEVRKVLLRSKLFRGCACSGWERRL